ncbi:MAG: glycoside hydrolase family 25 protein [Candidatus Hodarchaeales archaeon]|jgi:lysozyme
MSDFNPNLRDRADFFYPVHSKNWFTRTKNYLVSVLAQPTWIRGPDISHWNGEVDFQAIKDSGCDFVIIKATEGTGFLDPKWDYNWQAALDHELVVMPYHFFRSNYKGGEQFEWFKQNAESYLYRVENKTILWWDVETHDGVDITTRQNRLHGACVHTVKEGLQAGYYSSPYKWQTLVGNPFWVNEYYQWAAHWSNVSYPTLPIGWTEEKTKVWQNGIYPTYSWVEPIEGAGTVDHNYFFGTLQELRDLLGFTAPLPPDCCDKLTEIEQELLIIKSRLAQGELKDISQDEGINQLKIEGVVLNKRILETESFIQDIKDASCK